MGMLQSDTLYQGVSHVDISVVLLENRKWPTSQAPVLNPRHSFHIVLWTTLDRGILKKAGKKLKGTEPYLPVWLVERYTSK